METLHRLFFALKPPVREARLIGLARDQMRDAQALVSNDRLHMTLGITDDYRKLDDALVDRMMAIGETAGGEPVPVCLDRLSGGTRSVALRSTKRSRELADLQGQIGRALDYWGLTRTEWTFNPHVTLLYWDSQPVIRPIAPIEWLADEFVLIHSRVGETRHNVLGRWPLVQRQQSLALI
jgi:2'-5' RNA ligase